MLIDERMARFYYTIALIANRILFVLGLLFLIGLFYFSPPLGLLMVLIGIGYYAYTEWLDERRQEMYAAEDRARRRL
jgi:hypothetical protein